MPLPSTTVVVPPPSSAPQCAAPSIPSAPPETTCTPLVARCFANACARCIPAALAARAPTIATTRPCPSGRSHPSPGLVITVVTRGMQLATSATAVKCERSGARDFSRLRVAPTLYTGSLLRLLHHDDVAHAHLLDCQSD